MLTKGRDKQRDGKEREREDALSSIRGEGDETEAGMRDKKKRTRTYPFRGTRKKKFILAKRDTKKTLKSGGKKKVVVSRRAQL